MRKEHAIHNEKACELLFKQKEFNDWVVTTAFYSAHHYLLNEIFPITEHKKTYESFDTYYYQVFKKKKKNGKSGKHAAVKKLTSEKVNSCSEYYNWLFDACMGARYRNYKIGDKVAETARKYLLTLKTNLKK